MLNVAPFNVSCVYSVHSKSTLATWVTVCVKNSCAVERGTLKVILPFDVPLFDTPKISLVPLLKLIALLPLVPNSDYPKRLSWSYCKCITTTT